MAILLRIPQHMALHCLASFNVQKEGLEQCLQWLLFTCLLCEKKGKGAAVLIMGLPLRGLLFLADRPSPCKI